MWSGSGIKVKIKVKSNGHECPFHTWASRRSARTAEAAVSTCAVPGLRLVQEVLPGQRVPLRGTGARAVRLAG